MGKTAKQNRTTFVRCPKNKQYPFNRLPAKLYDLNGYQLAIMAQILSNKDSWNLVKSEIGKRLGFPKDKFNRAWRSLEDLGYINKTRIQGGWSYIIREDPDFTDTIYSNCEGFTLTTGRKCKGGILTTTKKNYDYILYNTTGTDAACYDDQFNELKDLYPVSSTWDDGTKVLLNRKLPECKILYAKLLSTGNISHEQIIAILKAELAKREQSGTQQYQPALFNWLHDGDPDAFEDRILKPAEDAHDIGSV